MVDPFKFTDDDNDTADISMSLNDSMKDAKISNINLFLDSIEQCSQCQKKILNDNDHDFLHVCRLCEGVCCKDCTEYDKKSKSCWIHDSVCRNRFHFYYGIRCLIRIKK
jgi:hypothetical protein